MSETAIKDVEESTQTTAPTPVVTSTPTPVATPTLETPIRDLGTLEVTQRQYVSCLPKEADAVVLNYSADDIFRLSCKIPPQKLSVRVQPEYDDECVKVKVKHPYLFLSVQFVELPRYGHVKDVIQSFSIYAINSKKTDGVWLTPYMISNVYGNGTICFGALGLPPDLKSAYNLFWSSPFNCELLGEEDGITDFYNYDDNVDYVKKYNNKILKTQEFENHTSKICGNKYWASIKSANAILITGHTALLKQIPREYWRHWKDTPFVVALANRNADDSWSFDGGKFTFSLKSGYVTTLPNYSEKMVEAKKKYAKA